MSATSSDRVASLVPVSFGEVRKGFEKWLRTGGGTDTVRISAGGEHLHYPVRLIFHVLSHRNEVLSPYEKGLLRRWLLQHGEWEGSSFENGRTIQALTFEVAVRNVRRALGRTGGTPT